MTFLPIVERELREGARRKSTWRIRLTVAAVALLVSGVLLPLVSFFGHSGSGPGSSYFNLMTGYACVLCLLAGVFVTSDCISEEKRAGTLGLLFLTTLRGYDVVLGKLAAQFIHLGYALLAILPAVALPLLLGGVTGGELWRVSLALLNLLFFSVTAGLLASVLCREAGRATMVTMGLVVLFCALVPGTEYTLHSTGFISSQTGCLWLSPMQAFTNADAADFTTRPERFWISLVASHALGWLWLATACWRVGRSWQDVPEGKSWWHVTFQRGSEAGRTVRRNPALLDSDPVRWLIGETKTASMGAWTLAGLAIAATMIVVTTSTGNFSATTLSGGIIYGILFLMKLLFARQAGRFFADLRLNGELELLLSTPIQSRDLIRAQWAGLRSIFLGPVLVCLIAPALCFAFELFGALLSHNANDWTGVVVFLVPAAVFMATTVLDFMAVGNLGMWLALTMRKPHLATGAAILFSIILPNLLCGVCFLTPGVNLIIAIVCWAWLQNDFRRRILERPARGLSSP